MLKGPLLSPSSESVQSPPGSIFRDCLVGSLCSWVCVRMVALLSPLEVNFLKLREPQSSQGQLSTPFHTALNPDRGPCLSTVDIRVSSVGPDTQGTHNAH